MTTATAATPLDGGPKIRLGIMMFLQYAVWGVWLPVLAIYLMASKGDGGLGFSVGDVGWILGVAAASGALTAPFIAGQIADRFLNAEIALGALLLIGGVFNIGLAYVTDFTPFLLLSVAYSICYMPTIALTNSICFANLTDPDTAFPRVRVWGTIGWIVASTLFGLLYLNTNISLTWMPWFFQGDPKPEATTLIANALIFSGIISMAYGLYAMIALPRTRQCLQGARKCESGQAPGPRGDPGARSSRGRPFPRSRSRCSRFGFVMTGGVTGAVSGSRGR